MCLCWWTVLHFKRSLGLWANNWSVLVFLFCIFKFYKKKGSFCLSLEILFSQGTPSSIFHFGSHRFLFSSPVILNSLMHFSKGFCKD